MVIVISLIVILLLRLQSHLLNLSKEIWEGWIYHQNSNLNKSKYLDIYQSKLDSILNRCFTYVFSMQIAKALGGGQQSSNDDQWEAFKEAQLGDTSKFTE